MVPLKVRKVKIITIQVYLKIGQNGLYSDHLKRDPLEIYNSRGTLP
jgi:hypothetical protein